MTTRQMFNSRPSALEKELWQRLSADAGLPDAGYTRVPRWAPGGERKHSLVSLYRDGSGRGVVLKALRQKASEAEFAALVEAQKRAHATIAAPFTVPRVLAVDNAERAILMEEASGTELFDLIEAGEPLLPLLTQGGAWIAAFHRAGRGEDRNFQPLFNVKRLKSLQEEVRSGATSICDAVEFLELSQEVIDRLPDYSGPTPASWQHGDMNLHNFLVDGETVTGIDFTKVDEVPIGYDVARFLLHYGALLADERKLEPGLPIPRAALEAFFAGYDLAGFDNPSVQAILRVRILNDWMRYPDSLLKMKTRQRFRYERYRMILRSLLAG